MPKLYIEITAVTDNEDGTGTGTYKKTSGPGSVSTGGDINIAGKAAVDIQWTITAADYTFESASGAACDTPPIEQFEDSVTSNSDLTCSIEDKNTDLGFKYTLYLKHNGTPIVLDPRFINR